MDKITPEDVDRMKRDTLGGKGGSRKGVVVCGKSFVSSPEHDSNELSQRPDTTSPNWKSLG